MKKAPFLFLSLVPCLSHGQQWTRFTETASAWKLAVSGDYVFVGTQRVVGTSPAGDVFRFTGNGEEWTIIGGQATIALAAYGPYLYHVRYLSGTARYSIDSGGAWKGMAIDTRNVQGFGAVGPYIFAGTSDSGIYRSPDYGDTWAKANAGLTNLNVLSFGVLGRMLFVGTGGGIFRSTDSGNTWIAANSGVGPSAFAVIGDWLFAGTRGAGVYRSSDSGETWSQVNTGFLNNWARQIFALTAYGIHLFAGTQDGVYYTSDSGNSWTRILSSEARDLAVNGPYLFVAAQYVYSMRLSDLISVTVRPRHATDFDMNSRFRVGIGPGRKITFRIGKKEHVRLAVYDAFGNQVSVPVNSVLAPGTYETTMDGTGLPPGLNFLHLQAGEAGHTAKVVFQK